MPALIFDCDGVLADTERFGHLPAFNQMFAEFGVPVQWSESDYADLLKIGGGKERMRSILTPDFVASAGLPSDPDHQTEVVARWHRRKTEIYTALVSAGHLPARPGVRRITEEAHDAGWQLAVASTSAFESVHAVLTHAVGTELAGHFTLFAGDVVARKKPAPDIYQMAISQLRVDAGDGIAVEDSHNGMAAALAADLTCVVTTSSYTQEEDFSGAALVVTSLGDPGEPTEVLADPYDVEPETAVALSDLQSLMTKSHHQQGIRR